MRTDIDRRRFITAVSAASVAGIAGCTGGPDDGDDADSGGGDAESGSDDTDAEGGSDRAEYDVGMVYSDGGLGDNSFNDAAQAGIIQAAEEFDLAFDESQPSDTGEFGQFQQRYASSDDPVYDLVSCIGFNQTDALAENAPQYPDTNFMLVDSVLEEPNVANYVFGEAEGSFLMGVLAGRLTEMEFSAGAGSTDTDDATVGFVGGVDSPVIREFQAGYEAGVEHVSGDIEVVTSYVGSYADPSGGQEAALSMYQNGADIVYHAAGATGVGVFQAAQEEERFAFGVDLDQSITEEQFSDVILASMVKRVDTAVYESVRNVVNDDHQGGEIITLGLESNGVECVYGDEIGDDVPDEVIADVNDAREAIIADEIDVPTEPSDD